MQLKDLLTSLAAGMKAPVFYYLLGIKTHWGLQGVTPFTAESKEVRCLINKYDALLCRRFSMCVRIDSDIHCFNELLLMACELNETADVEFLLTIGADINYCDSGKETPLRKASEKGHHKLVKLLIERGAIVDGENNYYSPLIAAAGGGHLLIVRELLEHKANPNHTNSRLLSSLYFAIQNGYFDIVKLLVKYNADVNFVGFQGTPLDTAIYCRKYEMIPFLILNGATYTKEQSDSYIHGNNFTEAEKFKLHAALQLGFQKLAMQKAYTRGAMVAFFKLWNLPQELGFYAAKYLTEKEGVKLTFVRTDFFKSAKNYKKQEEQKSENFSISMG